MSFRFVTAAVGILGAAFVGTSAVVAPPRPQLTAAAPTPLAVPPTPPGTSAPPRLPPPVGVVQPPPVAAAPPPPPQPLAPAPAPEAPPQGWRPPRYIVATNDLGMPKIWVGPGGHYNPTGRELRRDEEESGWADDPEFLGRELISGLGVVPVRRPNPDVLVVPGVDIGPDRGGSHMIIPAVPRALVGPETRLAPSVRLEPETPGRQSALPGWALHIASYRSQPAAEQGWAQLSAEHPAILGGLPRSFLPVAIPGRGPFVRLLAGQYASHDAAQGACGSLQSAGIYCQVVGLDGHARF